MADAIDDLRYISRMGYRDPWAEATKNITDSLLAYGNSKLKRDLLIADYEDKKIDREDKKIKERIAGHRYTYGMMKSFADKVEYVKNPEVAQDVFGPEGMVPGLEHLERQFGIEGELKGYDEIVKDPASSFHEIKNAYSNAKILSTESGLSNQASAYGQKLQMHQNKFIMDSNKDILTEFALSGSGKWITEAEADKAITDLEAGKISQVEQTLNRAYSQKSTDLSYIEQMYSSHIAKLDGAFRDSDGFFLDDIAQLNYDRNRLALDKRIMGMLPKAYQDWRNDVKTNIENARLRLDPVTGLPLKDDKLDDKKLKIEEPTAAIFNPRLLSPDSTEEKSDVSGISMVTIKNRIINKIETIPGTRAQDLINRGRAELVVGDEKSYIDVGLSTIPGVSLGAEGAYVSRMQEELSYISADETKQRIPLRVGDEVIDKSSGKRKKITAVKVSDSPNERTSSPGGYSAIKIYEKYTYTVDGERIKNYKDFQNRFAIPLWIRGKDKQRPTVNNFKEFSVIPEIK